MFHCSNQYAEKALGNRGYFLNKLTSAVYVPAPIVQDTQLAKAGGSRQKVEAIETGGPPVHAGGPFPFESTNLSNLKFKFGSVLDRWTPRFQGR